MNGDVYWPLWWAVVVGGLLPSAYFVATWRPARRWSTRQLDTGGWVPVIAVLYLLAGVRGLLGLNRLPETIASGLLPLAIGAAIDGVLWLRAVRWAQFRRNPTHPLRRSTDPCECATDDAPSTG